MRFRGCIAILTALGTMGCLRGEPNGREWPVTLATHPRAMTRLARLMREQFTSPAPAELERRIRCEATRLERALGRDLRVRQRWLTDSLRVEFTSEQFNDLGQRLAAVEFPLGEDPLCRTIAAEAEAEAPVAK